MGCQSSKAVQAPVQMPAPQSPGRTLLEGPEGKKEICNASAPEQEEAHRPVPSVSVEHPAAPSASRSSNRESADTPMSAGVNSNAPADSVRSHGSIHGHRKQQTVCTASQELDVMVVGYAAHDSTVGSALGRNCKQVQWKVMYDREAAPIDIKLNVQEHKLHSNEVRIESDGQSIFQGAGPHAKTKMNEDFHYQWSIRGTIRGINEFNYFEVRPAHFSTLTGEAWFPATITGQREDGHFEVVAQEPGPNGVIAEVKYPAVHRDNLREAASKKLLVVPENNLMLEVPQRDPLQAVLSMCNGDNITHHFGKPSPPLGVGQQSPEISLKVSKDRSEVAANVGHDVLSHFVSGEVRGKASEAAKLKHAWTVQLGPFAEHTIEISKRHSVGKVVTLLVDGDVLVESTAADIGCVGEWQCKFRLAGERALDFEVYKTNPDGGALEETGHVKEKRKYAPECFVAIPNDWDFSTARLFIDGTHFAELPMEDEQHQEKRLTMTPMALMQSYSITTPYMVDPNACSSMMMLANQVLVRASNTHSAAGGFFARCYDCSSVDDTVDARS